MENIKDNARYLKLPNIKENYKEMIKEAEMNEYDLTEFLDRLLIIESATRFSNGVQTKLREAKFPNKLTLEDFQFTNYDSVQKKLIKEVMTLDFLSKKENILLFGNPGVGKSHLAIGLGIKICLENKTVLFISVPNLMIEIKEQMNLNQLQKYKKRFEKYDLVILDEMGYISFDKDVSEILFNLLSNRNQKGSMIITTNLPFDRWGEIFKDQILTTAIIDRLAYKSHIIDLSGESYRAQETLKWINSK
jgi:DNA replication protein DnaC